jgi:hypothetical protein
MIQAAEIEQRSLEERLQTMELLWASLARTSGEVVTVCDHLSLLRWGEQE